MYATVAADAKRLRPHPHHRRTTLPITPPTPQFDPLDPSRNAHRVAAPPIRDGADEPDLARMSTLAGLRPSQAHALIELRGGGRGGRLL